MAVPNVFIIDDEKNLVRSLIYGLKTHGIRADGAFDGESGLQAIERLEPDLVFIDLRLPDISGFEVLKRLKERYPDLPAIMISAHGDTRAAVEAVKAGAEDFLTKPFDLDELVHLVQLTVSRGLLAREVAYRRAKAEEGSGILGDSTPMAALREQIAAIAKSGARTVLLLGESGTGKALVARALHNGSARATGPFVEVNCASLPETLLEAELFGAERGAYTGAYQKRIGLAQLADGGTLFLDEIGELALSLQAKLLHVIEARTFRPIGSTRERTADVRVVAATNRDIEAACRDGTFRTDLFYRLNVVPLTMPRLADRGDDVILLAEHFAHRIAGAEGQPSIVFDETVRARFRTYPWPGNVRELKNLVERLTILRPGQRIELARLPPEFQVASSAPEGNGLTERLVATERDILLRALAEAQGRKGKAAEALGLSRHAFKRRLQRLKLA